jgi:hypothetical protein
MDRPEPYSGLEVVEPTSYYATKPADETDKETVKETVPDQSLGPGPRKRVWPIAAMAVVILLVIAGVAGGVVGGLKSRHHHKTSSAT